MAAPITAPASSGRIGSERWYTTTGCGAAYSAWQSCQKEGCASCFAQPNVPHEDRHACVEDAARTICDAKANFAACGDLDAVPEYKAICEQPGALTDEYLGRFYNYFCGTPGTF